ncbi:MAG: hypothetical protein FJ295_12685 [Planctomycetes bacterium]|nr:hypothetical protein [Planctomycetota bacterium]
MLLQLIRLAENPPEQSDRALWDRIDAEPEVARQWQQLQHVRELLDCGRAPPEPLTVPTDLLVAWLEGILTEARAAEVETACWKSTAQLAEVVSNYRFLNRVPIMSDPPTDLTRRILRLVPPLPIAQPLSSPSQQPVATPTNRLSPPTASDPVPHAEPTNGHRLDHRIVVARRDRSNNRRTRTTVAWFWPLLASAALLVALLFAAQQLSRVRAPAPGDRNIVRDQPPPVQSPDIERPSHRSPRDLPLDNPEDRLPGSRRSGEESLWALDGDTDIEPIPEPTDPPLDTEPLIVEQPPPKEFQLPEHSAPFELKWTDIRGLLATRGIEPGRWAGVDGKQIVDASATLVTLPGSWSSAELSSGGQLTMAPDTEISLAREDGPSSGMSLMLRRGKVALRGFPRGQRLRVHSGEHALDAESISEYATIAVSLIADDTVVSILDGEIQAADEHLTRHQQLVLGRELPRVVIPATEARDSLEWLEPPATDWTKRNAVLARLRKSTDLGSDLVKLFDKHETRQWATVWSLALVPEDSLWRALTHESRAVRLTALEVLRTIPRRDERLTALRQALHRELGAPGAGKFLEWILLARSRTLPKPAVAQGMLEGLTDRRLVVRQTAIYCLDQIYAKPFPRLTPPRYEPEHWSRESVMEWASYVKAVHELAENRNPHRGPANLQPVPQRPRN